MRRYGVNWPFLQLVDQFHHLVVMVLDDPGALWSHHLLSVASALVHRSQDSILRRVRVASATVDENRFYELFYLLFQLFICNRLVEKCSELPIRTLETAE